MKLKRLVALALVGGLVVGGVTFADAKKKKKKKKAKLVAAESQFFLRHEGEDCADESTFFLSLTDGEDFDCQYAAHAAWPALGFVTETFPAVDGVPLKLDATRNVTGVISMRSYFVGAGAGPASVTVQLTGTAAGEEVELGEWSTEYVAEPTATHTFEYEIDVDDALSKKRFTGLTATVIPDGTTVGLTGVIEYDTPPSTLTIPTLVKKK